MPSTRHRLCPPSTHRDHAPCGHQLHVPWTKIHRPMAAQGRLRRWHSLGQQSPCLPGARGVSPIERLYSLLRGSSCSFKAIRGIVACVSQSGPGRGHGEAGGLFSFQGRPAFSSLCREDESPPGRSGSVFAGESARASASKRGTNLIAYRRGRNQ